MKFLSSAVIVVLLGLLSVGSSTRCYLCSGLLTDNCAYGVHEEDLFFRVQECDGKCIKLSIPTDITAGKDATTKMCAPFVRAVGVEAGSMGAAQNAVTVDQCRSTDYCHVCDGDLCNAGNKIVGVTFSIVITSMLLVFMY